MSHTGCEKFLLRETVERLLAQTAIFYQQRACVNSVGPPYRRLDQDSKPTPVDTTTYDRMNRHGSLSPLVCFFFTRPPPHLRSLGARDAHASHRLGDLRHWGRQARTRGPHLRLLPGPVRGRPATLAVSLYPTNIAVVRGRAWSESPGRKPEQDLQRTRGESSVCPGPALATSTMRSDVTRCLALGSLFFSPLVHL